jgi:hypothetical protein
MRAMEYATCPASSRPAPDRCAPRAQRLGQVKFVALVLEPEPEAETLSSSPARLYRSVRAFFTRVCERLVAARP